MPMKYHRYNDKNQSTLTHCILLDSSTYMLDESMCPFREVGSILSLSFNFDGKSCEQTIVMPQYVTSDLWLHC